MPEDRADAATREYIERWATLFESFGTTPMFGRLVGWLLVCDPPEQSPGEIAAGVGVSLSSVSTSLRMMLQTGLVERVRKAGERSTYYRLRPEEWGAIFERRLEAIRSMRSLAEDGLSREQSGAGGKRGSGRGGERDRRLLEVVRYCSFLEREFEEMMERWRKEREKWDGE